PLAPFHRLAQRGRQRGVVIVLFLVHWRRVGGVGVGRLGRLFWLIHRFRIFLVLFVPVQVQVLGAGQRDDILDAEAQQIDDLGVGVARVERGRQVYARQQGQYLVQRWRRLDRGILGGHQLGDIIGGGDAGVDQQDGGVDAPK